MYPGMIELRVTRPELYGDDDLEAGQGYYFMAGTVSQAIHDAKKKYPDEVLDFQYWHGCVNHGQLI